MIETKSELVRRLLTIAYPGSNDTFPYSEITMHLSIIKKPINYYLKRSNIPDIMDPNEGNLVSGFFKKDSLFHQKVQ